MQNNKRVLSVFSLVMINVIAVDSLRTLPISAKLGLPLVSYYLLAALAFFLPVALVSAELATAYPKTGGIYVWVREAFGRRAAFTTIWLQWIYNVVWYPTILAFIATTVAYLFAPELAQSKPFLLLCIIGFFWLFTLLNCFGMRVSSLLSTVGAILGTLFPIALIIALAGFWFYQGKPSQLDLSSSLLPDFSKLGNFPLFSAVLFGLLGMEMSAVHAEEVRDPQKDYPRALLYSTMLIFSSLVLGSLAILVVLPLEQLSVVSALIDAFNAFFIAYKLPWMTSLIAGFIIIGGLSGVSTWIIGPTKGLLVAAQDGCIPKRYAKVNRHGAPVPILLAQALIFTILSSLFIVLDSINAAYWMLSDLCAQMALLVYVFMFAAALKLRFSRPEQRGAYRIPGGRWGISLVSGLGLLCCTVTIILGFIPPTQIPIDNVYFFELFLVLGLCLFCLIPWIWSKNKMY